MLLVTLVTLNRHHQVIPLQVGGSRMASHDGVGGVRLVYQLHLQRPTPEAEAEWVDWKLRTGQQLHRLALVGWSGGVAGVVMMMVMMMMMMMMKAMLHGYFIDQQFSGRLACTYLRYVACC